MTSFFKKQVDREKSKMNFQQELVKEQFFSKIDHCAEVIAPPQQNTSTFERMVGRNGQSLPSSFEFLNATLHKLKNIQMKKDETDPLRSSINQNGTLSEATADAKKMAFKKASSPSPSLSLSFSQSKRSIQTGNEPLTQTHRSTRSKNLFTQSFDCTQSTGGNEDGFVEKTVISSGINHIPDSVDEFRYDQHNLEKTTNKISKVLREIDIACRQKKVVMTKHKKSNTLPMQDKEKVDLFDPKADKILQQNSLLPHSIGKQQAVSQLVGQEKGQYFVDLPTDHTNYNEDAIYHPNHDVSKSNIDMKKMIGREVCSTFATAPPKSPTRSQFSPRFKDNNQESSPKQRATTSPLKSSRKSLGTSVNFSKMTSRTDEKTDRFKLDYTIKYDQVDSSNQPPILFEKQEKRKEYWLYNTHNELVPFSFEQSMKLHTTLNTGHTSHRGSVDQAGSTSTNTGANTTRADYAPSKMTEIKERTRKRIEGTSMDGASSAAGSTSSDQFATQSVKSGPTFDKQISREKGGIFKKSEVDSLIYNPNFSQVSSTKKVETMDIYLSGLNSGHSVKEISRNVSALLSSIDLELRKLNINEDSYDIEKDLEEERKAREIYLNNVIRQKYKDNRRKVKKSGKKKKTKGKKKSEKKNENENESDEAENLKDSQEFRQ